MSRAEVDSILAEQERLAAQLAAIRVACPHEFEVVSKGPQPKWPTYEHWMGVRGTHVYRVDAVLASVMRRCKHCLHEAEARAIEFCPYCLKSLQDRGAGRSGVSTGTGGDDDPGSHLWGCPTCKYIAEVDNDDDY